MNFKLSKATLTDALKRAAAVADTRSTMPLLAMACLRVTDAGLAVAATDLNVTAVSTIPLLDTTPGGVCVNAKGLRDIVANMPTGDVAIRKVENNWVEIKAGKVSYHIVGMPDRDFPKIPDHREAGFAEVDATALRELLTRTLFSVCTDQTRFHLNGVLFESNGATARMVSTDGHRLSKVDRKLTGPSISKAVIVPLRGAQEMKALLDGAKTVKLAVKGNHLFVARDGVVLSIKLIDAQFPPYEQVIPKGHRTRVVVDRAALLDAVKRCALLSSETRGLKLTVNAEGLALSGDNPDVGEVREELTAEVTGPGLVIGAAPKYVQQALEAATSDQVALELGGELEPMAIRPVAGADDLFIIMPMRV